MVLTEAFASGTPVVCSDIAGYRDVVRDGLDGVLVPPGDPTALGEALHDARRRSRPARRDACATRASAPSGSRGRTSPASSSRCTRTPPRCRSRTRRRSALRFGRACAAPTWARAYPRGGCRRSSRPRRARAAGVRSALPARRPCVGCAALGVGLTALALDHIGLKPIGNALLAATPVWVLVAFALMCASMLIRAEAWHAVLRAALPNARVRRRDAARGTMIGVLMSATLPARLGEPSRALIVARRLGRVRERLAGGARNARRADAPEPRRADGPRDRDVLDDRPLPGQRGQARRGLARPGHPDRRAAPRAGAAASRPAVAVRPRCATRSRVGARRARRRSGRACVSSATRGWARGRPPLS